MVKQFGSAEEMKGVRSVETVYEYMVGVHGRRGNRWRSELKWGDELKDLLIRRGHKVSEGGKFTRDS